MIIAFKRISTCLLFIYCLSSNSLTMGFEAYPLEEYLANDTQVNFEIRNEPGNDTILGNNSDEYLFHQFVTLGLIRFYQRTIGPAKMGKSCPMYPSCSQYGYLSFKNHNPFEAFMMTADRLHRCGHDLRNYSYFDGDGISGYFDPPDSSQVSKIQDPFDIQNNFQMINLANLLENAKVSTRDHSDAEDDRLFCYAETLLADRDYDRALTEYLRLLSYFPDSVHRGEALKGILRCFYGLGKYFSAIHLGQDVLAKKEMHKEDKAEINLLIGSSYLKLGNFRLCREYLSRIRDIQDSFSPSDSEFFDKSLLLEGLSYAKESRWKEAETIFSSISETSHFAEQAKTDAMLSRQGDELKLKNPAVAGVLGIIPGLGYLYDGYVQSAIASFIVNGLFFWGTAEAFKKDNESLGVVLGLFSFGFYTGNIYGSITSAQKRNAMDKDKLILEFKLGFPY